MGIDFVLRFSLRFGGIFAKVVSMVKFVVQSGEIFGFVRDEDPLWLHILATKPGSVHSWCDGFTIYMADQCRPATRADFADYRIEPTQYQNNPRYCFPTE